MYAQIYPGLPKYNNDSVNKRQMWFNECLKKISVIKDIKGFKEKQIVMPYNIGCGLAGGLRLVRYTL